MYCAAAVDWCYLIPAIATNFVFRVTSSQDMGWDLSEWLPLVQDRRFLPWLVKVPSEQQQVHYAQPLPNLFARGAYPCSCLCLPDVLVPTMVGMACSTTVAYLHSLYAIVLIL